MSESTHTSSVHGVNGNDNASISLDHILGDNHHELEHPGLNGKPVGGWDEEVPDTVARDGYCIECEDQPAQVVCEGCKDSYCEVCFAAQHRKGTRKSHVARPLGKAAPQSAARAHNVPAASDADNRPPVASQKMDVDSDDETDEEESTNTDAIAVPSLSSQPQIGSSVGDWFVERAKYIPLRLTMKERVFLRLLEASLNVSEYTDKIDVLGFGLSKAKRIVHQIRELCAIMSGLLLAADYKAGQELFQTRDFKENEDFYKMIFEIGRRHKIMNPDKMRTTYGKLVYVLQDSQSPEVQDILGFSCVSPIKTVYSELESYNLLPLLQDDLMTTATQEIHSHNRSRHQIQRDIKSKERAIEVLATRYETREYSAEKIRQCLYSIGDNHAFLRVNRDPCEKVIGYLKEYFSPTKPKDAKDSLAIRSGRGGARLSHDHSVQYAYVMQSLTLWREILNDMFHLWYLAEQDLLSDQIPYRLRNTGQGLNRVQPAPKTSRLMHIILHKAQKSVGSWVGSSVIHMGDHNVPNALMFIDKYTQVYRILLPICNTLQQLPEIYKNKPALRSYVDDEFGGLDGCKKEILGDFFRHGFDGSGADNFFDAGSCIDGRLTSAWNWCAQLEKKRYFPVFLLTGFVGFDGEW